MALKMIPSLFQSSGSQTPRRGPRITPDPLLTIRLPEGNQGIVLDLSEEGLGFLAASPVDEGRAIRFVLADRSNRKSEAIGELMWKDAAGKRGGLRFTQVSSELRGLIQSYLGQEDSTAVGAKEPLPPGFEIPDSFPSQEHAGILPDMEPRKPRNWNFAANATTVLAASLVAAAIWYNVGGQRQALSFDSVKQRVTAFVFNKINHVPFGWTAKLDLRRAQPEKAEAPVVNPAPTAAAHTAPEPAEISEPSAEETSAAPAGIELASTPEVKVEPEIAPKPAPVENAIPLKETKATISEPAPVAAVKDELTAKLKPAAVRQAAAPVEETDDQVAAARKLLTAQEDPANLSKGIQMLWQAVAKGNPSAEVELASLYLSGTGVSKSCSQAVVLLKAAQSRKSVTAQQKLAELSQFGCQPSEDKPAATLVPAVESH